MNAMVRKREGRQGKAKRQQNEGEQTNERNTGQTMPFQMGIFQKQPVS